MVFVAQSSKPPSFDFNHPMPVDFTDLEYRGNQEPSESALLSFEFEQSFVSLEGGHHVLRLLKPLVLRLDPETMRFTVQDWGIEMEYHQIAQLPRQVARRFLLLMSAAEAERLTEMEQAAWLRITDYVDFQRFCIERSAPRYMEGTLVSRLNSVVVEWHDGSRETIDFRVARALAEVNPGERFGVFAKLGKENKTVALERVVLLPNPGEEENWDSWPARG